MRILPGTSPSSSPQSKNAQSNHSPCLRKCGFARKITFSSLIITLRSVNPSTTESADNLPPNDGFQSNNRFITANKRISGNPVSGGMTPFFHLVSIDICVASGGAFGMMISFRIKVNFLLVVPHNAMPSGLCCVGPTELPVFGLLPRKRSRILISVSTVFFSQYLRQILKDSMSRSLFVVFDRSFTNHLAIFSPIDPSTFLNAPTLIIVRTVCNNW